MSSDRVELPAHSIAQYDQALKESEDLFADLILVYKHMRSVQDKAGLPEAVTVVGCSQWLAEEVTHEACASALAVAILAFDRSSASE
jgi:hypothetical protein